MPVIRHRFRDFSGLVACFALYTISATNALTAETELADRRGKLEGQQYTFSGTPAFCIELPAGCLIGERSNPNSQVVSLRTREGITVEASVEPMPETFHASHGGPFYFGILSKVVGKNHEFLAQRKIALANDQEAYRTDILWTIGDVQVHTVLVSVYTQGHWVFIAVHPVDNVEQFAQIPESLSLP